MKPTLTRQLVAEAGVTIADADGLKALTMRRVASALDVATMAPYRHVTDRDDLLVAMVDVITRDRRTLIDDDMGGRRRPRRRLRGVGRIRRTPVADRGVVDAAAARRSGLFDQPEAVLTRLEQPMCHPHNAWWSLASSA